MATCLVCGSTARHRFALDNRSFVACSNARCGLVFIHPQPTTEELDDYYREDYFGSSTARHQLARQELMEQIVRYAIGAVGRPVATILDFGCATGRMWEALEPRLRDKYVGLEPNPIARDQAVRRTGRPIVATVAELSGLPDLRWDICIMNQVVEHLRDPLGDLQELIKSAREKALLWIGTPNRRSVHVLRRGKGWRHYENRTHLFFFDRKSCIHLLLRAGYSDLQRVSFPLKYAHRNRLHRAAHGLVRGLRIDGNLTITARAECAPYRQ